MGNFDLREQMSQNGLWDRYMGDAGRTCKSYKSVAANKRLR